ncbi:MAG TPA: immunoglobulin-like domain-containing protein [Prolixibacteraceae bacterium]|nr:immunoglobulin-like domain-containing protein [Prolixibacteraceae bacterium]
MKNLKTIYTIAFLIAFGLTACEKDYEDLYTVTNYANFDMQGDEVIFNPFGSPFTDPGIKATEAGNEIPVTTTVSGDFFGASSFDANVTDRYLYNYSATNSDGYEATTSRYVYNVNTGNLVDNIEGLYTSTVFRNGTSGAQYTDMEYVIISKSGDNTYKLSDAIGGWYELGRALGVGYRAPGMTITANNIAANDFTFGTTEVGTFGGVVTMKTMTVNPADKTIVITNDWDAGYSFEITLKQVQL